MGKLSETERKELGQRYLTDYVKLSFKVKTEEEVKVRVQCKSPCPVILNSHKTYTGVQKDERTNRNYIVWHSFFSLRRIKVFNIMSNILSKR